MNEEIPEFVSHISENGERYESVLQHLNEVAEMAASFAKPFGGEEWAYAAGLLHDIGKYSNAFQRRILHNGPRTDHSTAGAYELAKLGYALISYCVAGHHGGMPNGGLRNDPDSTLIARLTKAEKGSLPPYDAWQSEVTLPTSLPKTPSSFAAIKTPQEGNYALALFARMIFSCLVDADYLCTERFMRGAPRENSSAKSLDELRAMLEERLSAFYPPRNPINSVRCGVLDDCLRAAKLAPGLFSLTVPTGGGKTYALMRFALNHATLSGRVFKRVICVEPYTSIIEQNAEVYRKVFGEDQVLEHHSNADFNDDEQQVGQHPNTQRLAAENWDMPIIVTTNVQLFESLYSNKPSRCRKLHNIANSVIVLDEAQMIPTKYLKPCVRVLAELVKRYGCTVVLCTATQPSLNGMFQDVGLEVTEIASNPSNLIQQLKRVTYTSLGHISDEGLADRILQNSQALCIVNSRRQARALYDLAITRKGVDPNAVFYLTTLMYPLHRSQTIETIRSRVIRGLPCIVLATSLVEAGVDLDFQTVFRAVAGIDSMVQAAGRCNREMRYPARDSFVYLFIPQTPYAMPIEVRQCGAIATSEIPELLIDKELMDVDSLSTVRSYFSHLYSYKDIDDKCIVKMLETYGYSDGMVSIPFAEVSAQFKLVEDGSSTVIIPTEQNKADIELVLRQEATRNTMRRLGRYGVGVYNSDRNALLRAGAIETIGENVFILNDLARYRNDTGLDLRVEGGEAVFL